MAAIRVTVLCSLIFFGGPYRLVTLAVVIGPFGGSARLKTRISFEEYSLGDWTCSTASENQGY